MLGVILFLKRCLIVLVDNSAIFGILSMLSGKVFAPFLIESDSSRSLLGMAMTRWLEVQAVERIVYGAHIRACFGLETGIHCLSLALLDTFPWYVCFAELLCRKSFQLVLCRRINRSRNGIAIRVLPADEAFI